MVFRIALLVMLLTTPSTTHANSILAQVTNTLLVTDLWQTSLYYPSDPNAESFILPHGKYLIETNPILAEATWHEAKEYFRFFEAAVHWFETWPQPWSYAATGTVLAIQARAIWDNHKIFSSVDLPTRLMVSFSMHF